MHVKHILFVMFIRIYEEIFILFWNLDLVYLSQF